MVLLLVLFLLYFIFVPVGGKIFDWWKLNFSLLIASSSNGVAWVGGRSPWAFTRTFSFLDFVSADQRNIIPQNKMKKTCKELLL